MSLYSRKLFINKRKRALKKLLVGLSLFLFGALIFYGVVLLGHGFLPYALLHHPLFPVSIMSLVALAAYKPLDMLYTEIFRRYLFKQRSYVHIMLMNLAEDLELVLDQQEMANMVVNTFGELLQLKTVALLVHEKECDHFRIVAAYGWNLSDYRRVEFSSEAPLMKLIRESGPHVVSRNRVVRTWDWKDANMLAHDFDVLQASWVVPLMVGDEITGALAFSAVNRDRVFDETEFQFFRKFAHAIARKVRNATLFLHLKQANEKLQDTQSKLMQVTRIKAIEQLATGLAHQIHNPLTIISGKAQVLLLQKDRVPLDERVLTVLKTIVEQTKRAADITKKLLMFSQGSDVPREPLHLESILEDTVALISYQTSLEQIEIKQTLHTGLPVVIANRQEMREVFFNLLLNAVQSIGSKGWIHIEMKHDAQEQQIEISIADSGKGIEPENIEKLFNPFFTTRDEALGLGLFVTKQIIHRSGGFIRAESRLGEGSLFTLRLPCEQEDAGKTGTTPPSNSKISQKSIRKAGLIFED